MSINRVGGDYSYSGANRRDQRGPSGTSGDISKVYVFVVISLLIAIFVACLHLFTHKNLFTFLSRSRLQSRFGREV